MNTFTHSHTFSFVVGVSASMTEQLANSYERQVDDHACQGQEMQQIMQPKRESAATDRRLAWLSLRDECRRVGHHPQLDRRHSRPVQRPVEPRGRDALLCNKAQQNVRIEAEKRAEIGFFRDEFDAQLEESGSACCLQFPVKSSQEVPFTAQVPAASQNARASLFSSLLVNSSTGTVLLPASQLLLSLVACWCWSQFCLSRAALRQHNRRLTDLPSATTHNHFRSTWHLL